MEMVRIFNKNATKLIVYLLIIFNIEYRRYLAITVKKCQHCQKTNNLWKKINPSRYF